MKKNSVLNLLILLPFIWLFSGMLIIKNGDKPMVAMVVISIIVTFVVHGINSAKFNIKHDKTLWVILAMAAYALFSYHYHGLSSRELRALICAALFLICFPRELLTYKLLFKLNLVGAIACFGYAFYQSQLAGLPRSAWSINAIPQATLSATMGIIALVQLFKHKSKPEVVVSSASLILSIIAIIFSQTRGIWLGFGCAAGLISLLILKNNKINWRYLAIGIAIIFTAGFSLKPQLEQRVKRTQHEVKMITSGNLNSSIGLRLQMWQLGPRMIKENVLLGSGDAHKDKFYSLYDKGFVSKKLYSFKPAHYHNQFLDRLIKNGLIGLALLLSIFIVPLAQDHKKSSDVRYISVGIVTLFSVAALTDVPFNHGQTLLMYLLLIGGLSIHSLKPEES